ncbi:MAG: Lrp/AsnC family transcriptional regulator [Halobacteriota archaeon]
MVIAYVLVKASTGDADRLREEIEACDGVDRVHIVAGDVDLIARATVDSPAAVKALVTGCIQAIDGVADTNTYIAMA